MTAVLNQLRALEDRLGRGEITHAQYLDKRELLLRSVEIAQTDFEQTGPSETPTPLKGGDADGNGASALGLSITVCLGVMALSIGGVLVFLPDLNLALTLGVTILAALSVALLRDLDN